MTTHDFDDKSTLMGKSGRDDRVERLANSVKGGVGADRNVWKEIAKGQPSLSLADN